MKELAVINIKGKEVDKIKLDALVFDGKINIDLMHQAVKVYLANQRKGLASTKTRGEVRGGGRKPWRQKGTGRARVGSIRSPLWRGGGITFGPKPHSFNKDISKKMKTLALKSVLNAKVKDDEIMILNELVAATSKTKDFFNMLKGLKLNTTKVKFVVDKLDNNIKLSCRNIPKIAVEDARNLTTYTALNCKKLVFTKEAFKEVVDRVSKGLK